MQETSNLLSGVIGALIIMILTKFYDAWSDNKKSKRDRRLWIFRSLVQDRFHGASDNFVAAINLIEIEFNGKEKVISAWNKLRDAHFGSNPETIQRKTNELLIEIGKILKFKDLSFTDPGYLPILHQNNYERVVTRDDLLIKLLKDNKITINTESSINEPSPSNSNINKNKKK